MKRSLLLVALFVAVGCAHQLTQPVSVKVVVNASPQVARQFDVAALQRAAESELSRVTLTNPRPIKLTVNIDLDSTDELFTIPHNRLKSGKTVAWKAIFDDSDEKRPTIRDEKSGQPVVVGSYAIVGEMGAKLEWETIVLLANDAQSGPRVQQDSIRSASRFLAERVMLVDERLRFHEERQHSRP
jgi:hypothetical protein